MATPQRMYQTDFPYHIYNRGNRKNEIFYIKSDYLRFQEKLKEYGTIYAVDILCYCLMPNHFHLILRQSDPQSIPMFMLALGTSYSKYFNIRHNLVGRLFQERYQAKMVDSEEYLIYLSRYIHLNPIDMDFDDLTRLTKKEISAIQRFPWSSYREYIKKVQGICKTDEILSYFSTSNPHKSYQKFTELELNPWG